MPRCAPRYTVQHPFLAPLDMDIIKLTAQFVARNGQKFLVGLTQREARNPQFDFLKPSAGRAGPPSCGGGTASRESEAGDLNTQTLSCSY